MREEIYDIGGMHCAACSSAVERVTKKLPGVSESSVNLPLNRLTISYDEAQTTPEDIINKIERAGFTATVQKPKAEKADINAAEKDDEIIKKQSKSEKTGLVISLVSAGILLVFSMLPMIFPSFPMPDIILLGKNPQNAAIIQMLLCIPVFAAGRRYFTSGIKSLMHGNPNMDTLVAVSAGASVIYSLVMTLLIPIRPHSAHELYFESAAVVVALVSLGKYLEAGSSAKTKSAIDGLIKLKPETATLVIDGETRQVPTAELKVGDVILIRAGASVPTDGVVQSGTGAVNEAMLTGESLPADKKEGDALIGGSILLSGALYMQVKKTGEDTVLAGIIKFVLDAQGKKAPIAKTADKVAGVFVPVVMAIAIISAVLWLIFGQTPSFALKIFTTVLVIACPCAMGLATPTAIIVGTGMGANAGILIRSGEALELSSKISVALLDKTGTVTKGEPAVTDVRSVNDNEKELLSAAASLEILSDHPIAKAITEYSKKRGIAAEQTLTNVKMHEGGGISAISETGEALYIGNDRLYRELGIDTEKYIKLLDKLRAEGKTPVICGRQGEILGVIAVADEPLPDAKEGIEALVALGIKPVLLTGDSEQTALAIAKSVGISDVIAEVLPTEKAEHVIRLKEKGETVLMVGDGINDAPALISADLGCAIGAGSDIAIDSADIILMRRELISVAEAVRLGRLTLRGIKQNLFWAFAYNVIGIPIAAGLLYPSYGILLSPMFGGLAMGLSSLFVVTNALRLKTKRWRGKA